MFWPLNLSSEFLGVPEDSNFPLLGVWVSSSHLSQSGVATTDLRLKWSMKQCCSPNRELSNGMSHATCVKGNWGDSRLLVVGSQTTNLTPGPSFGHNLFFRCPNGSCEPILDFYVSISFQWYEKCLKPLGFDLCNPSLNIWESNGTPTHNMGVHLECQGSFPHTLLHSRGMRQWLPGLVLARTLASLLL